MLSAGWTGEVDVGTRVISAWEEIADDGNVVVLRAQEHFPSACFHPRQEETAKMLALLVTAELSFSVVLRPHVGALRPQVLRCHASPAVASRRVQVLAQFDDLKDEGDPDEPVEYFFDPATAVDDDEDDPDPSPPMAEEAAEPEFDAKAQASQAAADAAGKASEAARGALASVQAAIAEAAAKAVSAAQDAAQQKLDEIAAVPTRLASAAEEAANQAVAEVQAMPTKVADAVQAKAEQVRDDASAAVQQKVADVKAAPGNALLNAKAAVDEQQAAAKAKVGPHVRTSQPCWCPNTLAWPAWADFPCT